MQVFLHYGFGAPWEVFAEFVVYGGFAAISFYQLLYLVPSTLKIYNIITSMEGFKQDWVSAARATHITWVIVQRVLRMQRVYVPRVLIACGLSFLVRQGAPSPVRAHV